MQNNKKKAAKKIIFKNTCERRLEREKERERVRAHWKQQQQNKHCYSKYFCYFIWCVVLYFQCAGSK